MYPSLILFLDPKETGKTKNSLVQMLLVNISSLSIGNIYFQYCINLPMKIIQGLGMECKVMT
jgi:hypothetical protein